MRRWHEAQVGFVRCASSCCRIDAAVPIAVSSRFGTSGGGCGRRRVQQVLEDPLAAQHRRGPRRVGRDRQDAGLREHAAARRAGQVHAAELRPGHAGNAVVLRQPLVEERVLAVEEIEDAAVFADDVLEEELRLAAHREAQVVVEVGEAVASRVSDSSARNCSHCPPKFSTSARDLRVAQHPPHLRGEDLPVAQRAGVGRAPQLSSGMLAQRKYDSRDASSCCADRRTDVAEPADGRDGRARCGTGSPARRGAPGSRPRALRRTSPSVLLRLVHERDDASRPRRPRPAAGRRGAPGR